MLPTSIYIYTSNLKILLTVSICIASYCGCAGRTTKLDALLSWHLPLSSIQCVISLDEWSKLENFGIFSMCLVYKFLIWCIWKIWYISGTFLAESLVETLNQCVCYLTRRKQRKQCGKSVSKGLVILCNIEVSGLAENKTGRELRSSENTALGFRYTIFVSQCIQR